MAKPRLISRAEEGSGEESGRGFASNFHGFKKEHKTAKMKITMELLRDFENISKEDVSLAGGKGASLGEMTKAGISVPDGFVILANSFEKFLEETDLNVEIDSILDSVNHKEIHTVETASEKVKALIMQAEMPQDITREIQKFFKNLNSRYVAVRSSATAEDSASAAWAGQLESYLNTTEETLLENVKRCWASLFTPRAIFYRFEKDLHKQKISVAVVVQKMVGSEKSGIAFSVHPITQDRNQLIIEAGFGLGEAIVSGQITPDSYVIEKQPRRIIDKNIQTQSKGLYRGKDGGNEWHNIPKEQGEKQVLSDKEILELSEIILKIENNYGFPCDIEWATEKGKFYIVQSRPITTLTDEKVTKKYFNKDDYVLSFWVQGVSIFVTDIHLDVYSHLGILFIIDNGMFKQYFLKTAYEQALEDGLKFYSDEHAVKEYHKNLKNHCNKLDEFFNTKIKGQNKISKETLEKFFAYTQKLVGDYTKMNFEYTDKAFAEREKNKIIETNLSIVAKFKDEVRAVMNKTLFEADGYLPYIWKVLSEQLSVTPSLLDNLTQAEILALYNGQRPDIERVTKRQKAFVYNDQSRISFEGKDAQEIIETFEEKIEKTDVLNGQVASKGKVEGKVKIIPVDYSDFGRVNREIEKMQQGDILVAETTAPELIVACKKAGAIVTDMGGLMSHAAIVSREFGIPCIVGTKNASKILKDGDRVEVDGNSGIVRILK